MAELLQIPMGVDNPSKLIIFIDNCVAQMAELLQIPMGVDKP